MMRISVVSPFQTRGSVSPAALPSVPATTLDDVALSAAVTEAADERPSSTGAWVARASGLALMVGLSLAGAVTPAMAQEMAPPPTSVSATKTAPTGQRQEAQKPAKSTQSHQQASSQAAPADTTARPAPADSTLRPAADRATTEPEVRLSTRPSSGSLIDIPAPRPGDLFPQLPPPLPEIPLPPLPSIPKPDSEPETPTRVRTESEPYWSLGNRTQLAPGESYSYGELDFGREWTLQVKKGPWRSETSLDAGGQIRMGARLDPVDPAGNATFSLDLEEKLSRDVGSATRVYGRLGLGIQGGFGYRFSEDQPLNAFRSELAIGAEHRLGSTLLYGEPFVSRVQDLSEGLSHTQSGLRLGVGHHVTERDYLQVEGKVSQYNYSDGRDVPAWGVRAGWQRRDGKVWWGPEVGYENRDGENRVTVGVQFRF